MALFSEFAGGWMRRFSKKQRVTFVVVRSSDAGRRDPRIETSHHKARGWMNQVKI